MQTVIISGNKSVNLVVKEQLALHFSDAAHIIEPQKPLSSKDYTQLSSARYVIIDLTNAITNSRLFIQEINEISEQAIIIVTHIYSDMELIKPLLNAGASAYLLIDILNSKLKEAIERSEKGKYYVALDDK